jgi:hypothetical protein
MHSFNDKILFLIILKNNKNTLIIGYNLILNRFVILLPARKSQLCHQFLFYVDEKNLLFATILKFRISITLNPGYKIDLFYTLSKLIFKFWDHF